MTNPTSATSTGSFEDWAILAAQFLSICLALLIVMGLARKLGEYWWLPGAAVFVGIAALFTFVAPYLDYTTEPLRDQALLADARRYEAELGLPRIPIRVEEVSNDTDQANAYAYGIGPSRRVVFWDTLLQEPFSDGEQRVVLAHELGHHSQTHLPEGIGWFALFAVPGAWILMRATRRRGGMGSPGAVPLALLVVVVFQLLDGTARERDLPADGGGGRLEGASGNARSGIARRLDGRFLEDGARRSGPAHVGSAHARNAPGARRPRRDGAGLGGHKTVADERGLV